MRLMENQIIFSGEAREPEKSLIEGKLDFAEGPSHG